MLVKTSENMPLMRKPVYSAVLLSWQEKYFSSCENAPKKYEGHLKKKKMGSNTGVGDY